MNKLISAILITVSFNALAGVAFLKSERVIGLNKICLYMGSEGATTLTIKSYQLCPLTIKTQRG